jgi:hypothetical protein
MSTPCPIGIGTLSLQALSSLSRDVVKVSPSFFKITIKNEISNASGVIASINARTPRAKTKREQQQGIVVELDMHQVCIGKKVGHLSSFGPNGGIVA